MNYKVKQSWALLFTVLLVLFMYLKRVIEVYLMEGMATFDNVGFWARTMLVYIVITVVFTIVVMVLFHILLAIGASVKNKIDGEISGSKENNLDDVINDVFDDGEDEMDRLINLKAGQVSHVIVGVGFVVGLITLTFDLSFGIMLNILYLSFMLGGIIDEAIKLYLYKRGVSHG